MIILSTPNSCHENWPDMTPTKGGAWCKQCAKDVVDFSAMPDEKIVQHFREATQPVCGRFRNDQLNRPLFEISSSIFAMEIPFWKKFLAALLIFFSAFITGCSGYSKQDYTKAELPVINQTEFSGEVPKDNPVSGKSLIAGHDIINPVATNMIPVSSDEFQFVTLGFTVSSEFTGQSPYCQPLLPDLRQKKE